MNIYIDFDDTIARSVENVVRIVNKRYNKNVNWQDIRKWDFSDVYPDIPLDDIVKVFGEQEFFDTLKLQPYAIFVLRRFAKNNTIKIVSKVDMKAMERKGDWIKEHIQNLGINISFIGIPLGASKGNIDMSDGIMIDDNAKFLKETNAKYKILYHCGRAFDVSQDWDGLFVSDWYELKDMLYDIISKEKGITNGKI